MSGAGTGRTSTTSGQRLKKRSVMIAGHATSLSLEEAFWQSLKAIAAERGLAVASLIEQIDRSRSGNLSSAARVFVLEALRHHGQG